MSTRILYVCTKYSVCDLIIDAISCCVKLRDGYKIINVDLYEIVLENKKKR